MRTILVAADKPFSKEATAKITALGATFPDYRVVFLQGYKTRDELLAAVADVDALVVRSDKVDAALLAAARSLKIVVRAGAGYDTIDTAACKARGVVVMNTPGQNSNAVAELAYAQAITVLRRGFTGKSGFELRGRRLGLQAFGAVARCMARIAQGFGMEVFCYDPYVAPDVAAGLGVKMVASLKELYATCSVVSIHTPLTPETRGSVTAELINAMPECAVLVNTARAEVVDEEAIKAALAARPNFCYAADVAPKCAAELVEKFKERVCFSSVKSGAQTDEANIGCGTASISQIVAFFEKGDTTFQVNK